MQTVQAHEHQAHIVDVCLNAFTWLKSLYCLLGAGIVWAWEHEWTEYIAHSHKIWVKTMNRGCRKMPHITNVHHRTLSIDGFILKGITRWTLCLCLSSVQRFQVPHFLSILFNLGKFRGLCVRCTYVQFAHRHPSPSTFATDAPMAFINRNMQENRSVGAFNRLKCKTHRYDAHTRIHT